MKPTEEQMASLSKFFGCARFVYNYALSERIDAYQREKKNPSFFDMCNSLRDLKKQEDYAWLNEAPAKTLCYSLLNLNTAFVRFFNKKACFPRFKSRKHRVDAFKLAPNAAKYDFDAFKVRVQKIGWIKLCQDRTFDLSAVKVYSTKISRDACGTYWCTVSIDDGSLPEPKAKVRKETAVGVDVGLSEFATLSNGEKIQNMRFFEREAKRIATAQRCLARKRHGSKDEAPSNRYVRYRTKLARIHRRVEDRRTDFLQKLSTDLVKRFDTICIEDLNIKGMMQNHHLAGAIGSASWSEFVRMICYKSDWYGVNLLRAGRFEPTSQLCSVCGHHNSNAKDLSVREWTCPICGTVHDRDVNAAVNIMNSAINKYFNKQSPEVTGTTDADGVDSENNAGMSSPGCNYASDEASMQNVVL